jgi:hypothetical protein
MASVMKAEGFEVEARPGIVSKRRKGTVIRDFMAASAKVRTPQRLPRLDVPIKPPAASRWCIALW